MQSQGLTPSPSRMIYRLIPEHLLTLIVFGALLLVIYAEFFIVPYNGFVFDPNTGKITALLTPGEKVLQKGDVLVRIGDVPFETFRDHRTQTLFDNMQAGEKVPMVVNRGGQLIQIEWEFPGLNWRQISYRLINIWPLAFLFWAVGTLVTLFVRPRDVRWALMIVVSYGTALWFMAGTLAPSHVWYSAILLRSLTFLLVPAYLHLHWLVPRRLSPLPWWVLALAYAIGLGMAVREIVHPFPTGWFGLSVVIGLAGSLILLLAHYVFRPEQRRETVILLLGAALSFLPLIILSIFGALSHFQPASNWGLIFVPALPMAYFFAIYRRQLGDMEWRANRLVTIYAYLVILVMAMILVLSAAQIGMSFSSEEILFIVLLTGFVTLAGMFGFPAFQAWVERMFLGMHLEVSRLPEAYAARITTSLDASRLANLLTGEILASLLVRQSALVRIDEAGGWSWLYSDQLPEDCLPGQDDLPGLMGAAGQYLPTSAPVLAQKLSWVRLVLPLVIERRLVGIWLLGKRDPDDYYSPSEISQLQTLANQTAVALMNIDMNRRLGALYQVDIGRREEESQRLALELHDQVLNQLAVLAMAVDENSAGPQFAEAYQMATTRIREIIGGLRPAMLNYGLRAALEELADEAIDQAGDRLQVVFEAPASDVRYPQQVELHLYRIIQQACQNALRHSQAKTIRIHGQILPAFFDMTVEDDGIGFEAGANLDLAWLLSNRHFGLAGMLERAALISAEVRLTSSPGRGTQVRVMWGPSGE